MKKDKNPKNIKKNPEKAVALEYRQDSDSAPKVIAKGEGSIAEKIKSIAQKHNIPIHKDNDLVTLLAQIDIDQEIPPELFAAVAEILSWIYRANKEMIKEND